MNIKFLFIVGGIFLVIWFLVFSFSDKTIKNFSKDIKTEEEISKEGKIKISESKPVFMFFEIDGCNWCKKMERETLNDLEIKILLENYSIVMINASKKSHIAKEQKLRSYPSYILYDAHNGREIKRGIGYKNKKEFKDWLLR